MLANNCYACHTENKLGGLRVDSRVALLEGGKSGPAIVPGRPDESLLIKAIRQVDPNLKMPMGGTSLKTTRSPICSIGSRRWPLSGPPRMPSRPAAPVAENTKFTIRPEQRNFWSFQPIQKPPAPKVKNAAWAKTTIDRFILAKLEEKNLKPVQSADKRALIRRAYFDLIGLPPSPEQVDAFLSDQSPDAFAKVVDRLLASPAVRRAMGAALAGCCALCRWHRPARHAAGIPRLWHGSGWVRQHVAVSGLGDPGAE